MNINQSDCPTADTPTVPLSPVGVFWYSLANLGFGAFYAFNNYVLPLWMGAYTHNAILLGLLGGSHSFEGVFVQPVVGSISDRMHGPGGRRRPFLRLFIALSALFLLLAPAATLLPGTARLAGIVACVFLFTLTFNVAADPYQALLADITTTEQRGRVSGIWFFIGATGQVLILLFLAALLLVPGLHLSLEWGFPIVGLLLLATTLLTCAKTQEPTVTTPPETQRGHWDDIRLALSGLRDLPQARIYMGMFFLYGAGLGAVTPYLTKFIKQVTGCADWQTLALSAWLLVVTALGSLLFGAVSSRIGFKPLLMLSLILIAAAALNALWVTTLLQVGLVLSVAGLGIGAQNASAYPLLTRLVPPREIGFYVGLQTAAASLAGPAAVALTGTLINRSVGHAGYRMIFVVCAVCLLLAMGVLSALRVDRAAGEVARRERELGA